jgi:hypothetical protein
MFSKCIVRLWGRVVTKIAIRSAAFPGVYLRLHGGGLTDYGSKGGGTANCQFAAGPEETFDLVTQADGTVAIGSTAFANVYLRLDGRGINASSGDGGTANGQFGVGPYEKFRFVRQPDGTIGIAAATFPNVYLRMDGRGVSQTTGRGGGTVNATYSCGPWEKFHLVDLYESAGTGDLCIWFDSRAGRSAASIKIPAHSDLAFDKPVTIEAWIVWDGMPGRRPILSMPRGALPNEGYTLALVDGAPAFDLPVARQGVSFRRTTAPQKIAKGVWTHVCVSFNGTLLRICINGVPAVEDDVGITRNPTIPVNMPLFIGRQYEADPDAQNGFFGLVRNVRFWNTMVPSDVIKAWAAVDDLSSHPLLANLMGYWRLDEIAGSTFYDSSWRGHDGQGNTAESSALRRLVYDGDIWMPQDRRFILMRDGGLAMDAGAATTGTAIVLADKAGLSSATATRQLWHFAGGRLIHAASGLVVDCSNPDSVALQPRTDGRAAQAWFFDRLTGAVRSPAAPGRVLRSKANGTGLAMETDAPRSPGEAENARRWFFLTARRRRPFFNPNTNLALTEDPRHAAPFDPANDGHHWYELAGQLLSDRGGALTVTWLRTQSGSDYGQLSRAPVGQANQTFAIAHDDPQHIRVKATLNGSDRYLLVSPGVTRDTTNPTAFFAAITPAPPDTTVYSNWSFGDTAEWTAIPGQFADMSVGVDGFVAALTVDGIPLYAAGAGKWRRFPSPPADGAQITVGDSSSVWLRNRSGQVFRFRAKAADRWVVALGQVYRVAPSPWEEISGRSFQHIDLSAAGSPWGVDNNGKLARYRNSAWEDVTNSWQQNRGHLTRVSVGNEGAVWGVNGNGEIWNFRPATSDWRLVPGQLASISVGGDGEVWGVNRYGNIYRYRGTALNTWQAINGKMARCSVGSAQTVWALGTAGDLYRYGAP